MTQIKVGLTRARFVRFCDHPADGERGALVQYPAGMYGFRAHGGTIRGFPQQVGRRLESGDASLCEALNCCWECPTCGVILKYPGKHFQLGDGGEPVYCPGGAS